MSTKAQLSFIIALLFLTSVIILDRINFQKVREHSRWVNHTHEVISQLEQLSEHFKSAQIYSRKLAKTTVPQFYQLYLNDAKLVDADIQKLKILVRDNRSQQQLVDSISQDVFAQMPALLVYNIAEIIALGEESRLTKLFHINEQIFSAIANERKLLAIRQARLENAMRTNELVSWIFCALATAIMALTFYSTFAETRRRRRLELELKDYVRRLEQSNSDLEQYAYVASHDLQEPLRKIRVFATQLRDSAGNRLEQNEQGYLEKIMASSGRMSQLIRGILGLSAMRAGDGFMPTDLFEIVRSSISDLDLLVAQTGARIRIEGLCTIDAIPLQMNQLFYNLLNNALKYARDGVNPVIEVLERTATAPEIRDAGLPPGDYCRVEVRDNGQGFSNDQAEQIFGLFKRLGSRRDGGSGIGLALCRKVVENHGGSIRAEGTAGEGACFTVFLPLQQAPQKAIGAEKK
jgi:signal transduction histidine kinase